MIQTGSVRQQKSDAGPHDEATRADAASTDHAAKLTVESTAESTRSRILDAGMRCFARTGYSGATTRAIAAGAGVTLPVIAYHFGNKEGLHRACAREILGRYQARMFELVSGARLAINGGKLGPADARILLDQVLDGLVAVLVTGEDDDLHSGFVMRELGERGPAWDYLYEELWRPGIRLVADLLAVAGGHASAGEGQKTSALLILSSLTAFTSQAQISLPVLGWEEINDHRRAVIKRAMRQLVDGSLV